MLNTRICLFFFYKIGAKTVILIWIHISRDQIAITRRIYFLDTLIFNFWKLKILTKFYVCDIISLLTITALNLMLANTQPEQSKTLFTCMRFQSQD